jgi:hypothetical protein
VHGLFARAVVGKVCVSRKNDCACLEAVVAGGVVCCDSGGGGQSSRASIAREMFVLGVMAV